MCEGLLISSLHLESRGGIQISYRPQSTHPHFLASRDALAETRLRLTLEHWDHYSTTIRTLFFLCCPPAIADFIIAVFIRKTVNRFALRPFAHVRKKCGKGFSPSVADADTPCAVPSIISPPRICAALDHASPGMVSWSHAVAH